MRNAVKLALCGFYSRRSVCYLQPNFNACKSVLFHQSLSVLMPHLVCCRKLCCALNALVSDRQTHLYRFREAVSMSEGIHEAWCNVLCQKTFVIKSCQRQLFTKRSSKATHPTLQRGTTLLPLFKRERNPNLKGEQMCVGGPHVLAMAQGLDYFRFWCRSNTLISFVHALRTPAEENPVISQDKFASIDLCLRSGSSELPLLSSHV